MRKQKSVILIATPMKDKLEEGERSREIIKRKKETKTGKNNNSTHQTKLLKNKKTKNMLNDGLLYQNQRQRRRCICVMTMSLVIYNLSIVTTGALTVVDGHMKNAMDRIRRTINFAISA